MASATGDASNEDVVDITFKAATAVLSGGAGRHAFRGCGWEGDKQRSLGWRASRRLHWRKEETRCLPEFLPLLQFQTKLCGRRTIPVGWLFHCVRVLTSGYAVECCPLPLPDPDPPVPAPHAWFGRLRSSSGLRSPSTLAGPRFPVHLPLTPWRPPSLALPPPRPPLVPAAAPTENSLTRPPLPLPARPPPVGRPLLQRKRSRESTAAASTSGSPT